MAILTVSDVEGLCLGEQTSESLRSLLRQAQSLAEGPEGAHRPLEKGVHREIITIGGNGVGRFTRLPIDATQSVTIEMRGHYRQLAFGVATGSAAWVTLAEDTDYQLDADTGEIRLVGLACSTYLGGLCGHAEPYGLARSRSRRMRRNGPKLQATYTTGWDFQSSSLDAAGMAIKDAVKALLELLPAANESMTTNSLLGMYSRQYDMKNIQAQMDRYLSVLQQWRPKEFA